MDKPFHLMTPEERTALRIAQNRAIAERVAQAPPPAKRKRAASASKSNTGRDALDLPPAANGEHFRGTPEERAELGGFIRKMQN